MRIKNLSLLLGLLAGLALIAPDAAFASERPGVASCKKSRKKRSKRKKRVRRVRAKRVKKIKVTASVIKKWQKSGMSDDRIVDKATAAGYRVTPTEAKRLKKLRVRSSLRTALADSHEAEVTIAATPEPRKPINLQETINPNDIDFDSVPPPEGTPTQYTMKKEPEKKTLNTSLRPSAPFVPKASGGSEEKKPRRVIFSAAN